MADTTFTIGAAAVCSDGPCGAVSRVVVDPVARELTHLVVEPEHRSGLGRLVPLAMVESGADDVRLRYTLAEFEKLPSAEETDFLPGGSGYDAYAAHEAYYWPYFGLEGGADPRLALASAVETRDMLPPGEIGVRRGEARARERRRDRQGGGLRGRLGRRDTSRTCSCKKATSGAASRSPSRSAPSRRSTRASPST